MSLWQPRSVTDEPDVVLIRWAIYRINDNELHFVGTRADKNSGRVSSTIVQLDLERRVGTTRSGRVYALEGHPGIDSEARYVWNSWCRLNGVTASTNVTKELLNGSGTSVGDQEPGD
ncbi:hypothetical protein [Burkholderia pseudomallei]|uniref:hypothetical protein n=1 Tax=Burkholderia pseudomallei TaxID=28450 RepID=UPI0005313A8A|nr:hypothetical protein [Burkholderia pseudomallei]KAA8769422.1 hypothetical protein F5D26_07725 [Burkholderia pseudomallei]KGS31077.1 hypothetical protein X941_2771 [Burkholderia pseudomallei MSHR5569]KGW56641.1 hypothetical protein Y042_1723 [Burkholderia pseudomallei MSHR1357]KKC13354.1 hypothetical protein BBL_4746 [Burkholderia pseudomallei MSHR1328]MBM5665788.1 hypothetical protein [Burkholderia pseudomallei]